MGQVQVSVPELRALGTDVVSHAAALKSAVTTAEGKLAPAAGTEWATIEQATTAAHGWAGFLTALAGRVDAAGRSLISTADLYQAADERAAGRMGPR